jgi:cation diffusion facilitator CzcD-associated flavoprotein CzcO
MSMETTPDTDATRALRERIAHDIECLSYPSKPWVTPRDAEGQILNCIIVGGGQYGQSLAFGLARDRVDRVVVFDANPAGFAGPWMTFARMIMLRTPKDLTGPDLGIGSLTFRSWYEARYGVAAWDALFRIQRPDWQAYLNWHRDVTGIDVRPASVVTRVAPVAADLFEVDVLSAGQTVTHRARTVILASGAEGSGARSVPPLFAGLSRSFYAHTNDSIDFSRLAGKRVGILGAGASSFDNATAALVAGAASAELSFRRSQLPLSNPRRWMEFAGFLAHYPELPDEQRWRYMKRLYDISQPPPEPTFKRAVSLPGFRMRPATPWLSLNEHDGVVRVETPEGTLEYDFVIAGTGITVDLNQRPELAAIAPHVALWGDRFVPPAGEADERLARFPYLDRYGAFMERTPGSAPWASRLFAIFRAATLSLGPSSASNSNIRYTAPRIVSGVTRALFLDEADSVFAEFMAQAHHELQADAVVQAVGQSAG